MCEYKFQMMRQNDVVFEFAVDEDEYGISISSKGLKKLQEDYEDSIEETQSRFKYFIQSRINPQANKLFEDLTGNRHLIGRDGYLLRTRLMSVFDTYWVRSAESDVTWDDVKYSRFKDGMIVVNGLCVGVFKHLGIDKIEDGFNVTPMPRMYGKVGLIFNQDNKHYLMMCSDSLDRFVAEDSQNPVNEPKVLPTDMTMGYLKLSQRDLQRFQNTLAQVSDCSKQVFRVLSTGYASQIADEFGVKCFNIVVTVPELKSENLSMGFEIPDNLDFDDVDPLTVWCNVKSLDSDDLLVAAERNRVLTELLNLVTVSILIRNSELDMGYGADLKVSVVKGDHQIWNNGKEFAPVLGFGDAFQFNALKECLRNVQFFTRNGSMYIQDISTQSSKEMQMLFDGLRRGGTKGGPKPGDEALSVIRYRYYKDTLITTPKGIIFSNNPTYIFDLILSLNTILDNYKRMLEQYTRPGYYSDEESKLKLCDDAEYFAKTVKVWFTSAKDKLHKVKNGEVSLAVPMFKKLDGQNCILAGTAKFHDCVQPFLQELLQRNAEMMLCGFEWFNTNSNLIQMADQVISLCAEARSIKTHLF